MSREDQARLETLKRRDAQVRPHEQAHLSAAGPYAHGGPRYLYEVGPDGKHYAVAGAVQIDVTPIPDDPQATIHKMQIVQAAALAPAEPSPQDRAVAAKAATLLRQAEAELARRDRASLAGPLDAPSQNAPKPHAATAPRFQTACHPTPQLVDVYV